MKNYLMSDVSATLFFLAVVLFGGYLWLQHKAEEQNKLLQIPEKRVELKAEKMNMTKFEVAVKRTE